MTAGWLHRAAARIDGLRRWRGASLATGAIVAASLFLLPHLVQPVWIRVGLFIVIWSVLASGLNILAGFCGLLDLGYVAFFAIGGYFSAIMTTRYVVAPPGQFTSVWWIFLVDLVGGGLLAGLAGLIIGYPTLRLRGDYVAIMTLGFGEVIRQTALNWSSFTNGPSGIRSVPLPSILGVGIESVQGLFYLSAVIALVCLVMIRRLLRSHIGRAWVSIREDEDVAESLGVPTARYKLYAYVAGAVFAGIMGVFFAHVLQFISPDSFSLFENIVILLLVVVGGLGSLLGPVFGAAFWFLAVEELAHFSFVQLHPEVEQMLLAVILITMMLLRPHGLFGQARTLASDA
jgi:branched-chain amino acid transport system permease protein